MAGQKRSRSEYEHDHKDSVTHFGLGDTVSRLREDGTERPIQLDGSTKAPGDDLDDGWHVVGSRTSQKKQRKRARDEAEKHDGRPQYPSITHSPHARLQSQVKISDLQTLVLYLFADGPAPQWVGIRQQKQVRKVVVLLVPGLEAGMFDGSLDLDSNDAAIQTVVNDVEHRKYSPDDYYPRTLHEEELAAPLQPIARMFPELWPVQTPGDSRISRLWSPLAAMLSVPLPKSKEEKQQKGVKPAREAASWRNKPTPVTEYIATMEQLSENDYVLHDALLPTTEQKQSELEKRCKHHQTAIDGWLDTVIERGVEPDSGSSSEFCTFDDGKHPDQDTEQDADQAKQSSALTGGRHVLALDCEMCQSGENRFELTRISVLDWSGNVVLDTLVKPNNPITNYLTPYSGITAEMLEPVTTSLSDVQRQLTGLMKPDTILLGHSFNSDLSALKITHPYIVDTSVLYPHPGGSHLKSSLKWLSEKYLSRTIQKGVNGHNSIEDARAALDLVKQKCQRGPTWGTSEATVESIFRRIGRNQRTGTTDGELRRSALIDWGVPKRGYGAAADVCIGCSTDEEVVKGIERAVNGDEDGKEIPGGGVDFVWARFRELEAVRGWWVASKTADNDMLREQAIKRNSSLSDAVGKTVSQIEQVYRNLPPCTAFVLYSGTGDPRELAKWQNQNQQFRAEYKVKKWDELSTKWTDSEEQMLRQAFRIARESIAFVTVK